MNPVLIFTVGFTLGSLFALAACVYLATRNMPGSSIGSACAFEGCTTNHYNPEKFCSYHIRDNDDYEDEHGRGSRPG